MDTHNPSTLKHVLSASIAVLFYFTHVGASDATSFDCNENRQPDEQSVCSDAKLSALDVETAALFGRALADDANPGDVRNLQRAFLKRRRDCQSDSRCIEKEYRQRIIVLQRSLSQRTTTTTVPVTSDEAGSQISGPDLATTKSFIIEKMVEVCNEFGSEFRDFVVKLADNGGVSIRFLSDYRKAGTLVKLLEFNIRDIETISIGGGDSLLFDCPDETDCILETAFLRKIRARKTFTAGVCTNHSSKLVKAFTHLQELTGGFKKSDDPF